MSLRLEAASTLVPMTSRWIRAQQAVAARGLDALVITPGADLRYLTGYQAKPLERLTAFVLPASGDPTLIVPELELSAAVAAGTRAGKRRWRAVAGRREAALREAVAKVERVCG